MDEEILVSFDGEFTGLIPGLNSLISLGMVAYTFDGNEIGRFKVNMFELEGSERNPDTMEWWAKHEHAWQLATHEPVDPLEGMQQLREWLKALPGKPKLMGWPLPVDFMFVYWYYVRFLGEMPPFLYDGIDIKSVAMVVLDKPTLEGTSYTEVQAFLGLPNGEPLHEPVQDAIDQADVYFGLMRLRQQQAHRP